MNWTLLAVIVVLGLSVIFVFRKNIAGLIDRIKSIGASGVAIDPQQHATPPPDPHAEAEAVMRLLDDPVLVDTERALTEELRRRNLLGSEAVPALIRLIARQQINLQFNDIYHRILGSQLRALQHLNTNPGPNDRTAIEFFYTEAALQNQEAYRRFDFNAWLSFLRTQGLITEHSDGRIELHVRGRSFLTYLVQNGAALNRLY
jgi:hypothetical protein